MPLVGPPGRPPGPPAPQRPELPARPSGGVAPSSTIQQLPQPECPRPLASAVSSVSRVVGAPALDVSPGQNAETGGVWAPPPPQDSWIFPTAQASITHSLTHPLTPRQQQGTPPEDAPPHEGSGGQGEPKPPSAPPTEGPLSSEGPACAGGCRGGVPRKARSLRALPTAAHYRFDEC